MLNGSQMVNLVAHCKNILIFLQAVVKISYSLAGRYCSLCLQERVHLQRPAYLKMFEETSFAAVMQFPGMASKASDTPLSPDNFSVSSPVHHRFPGYRDISEGNSRSGWDFAAFSEPCHTRGLIASYG